MFDFKQNRREEKLEEKEKGKFYVQYNQ